MKDIRVPFLGEGIDKIVVSSWHLKEGDHIVLGQDVAEVAADKAIFNIASEQEGPLKKILVLEGKEARIGEVLAVLE